MSLQRKIEDQLDAKEARLADLENEVRILLFDIEQLEEQLRGLEEDRDDDEPGMGEYDLTGSGDQDL